MSPINPPALNSNFGNKAYKALQVALTCLALLTLLDLAIEKTLIFFTMKQRSGLMVHLSNIGKFLIFLEYVYGRMRDKFGDSKRTLQPQPIFNRQGSLPIIIRSSASL